VVVGLQGLEYFDQSKDEDDHRNDRNTFGDEVLSAVVEDAGINLKDRHFS